MKQLFSLYRRNGIYYAQNTQNGKQESLRTRDEAAAKPATRNASCFSPTAISSWIRPAPTTSSRLVPR